MLTTRQLHFVLARFLILASFAVVCFAANGAENADSSMALRQYVPDFHGQVRARYELKTDGGEGRFAVRNARLSARGVLFDRFGYFVMADLCDRGTVKFLDGYAWYRPLRGLDLRAGQFRMPFGADSFMAPFNYVFANRSYIGKYLCNFRGVGCQGAYTFAHVPLTLSGGVFNACTIAEHERWTRTYAWSFRAVYTPGRWRLTTGFQSVRPFDTRINLCNAAVRCRIGALTVDAEYMYKHYTCGRLAATHGYLAWANYDIALKHKTFNRLSCQARFDGMTVQSAAKVFAAGRLTDTDPGRNRVTAGTTLSHIGRGAMHADLRLNYEKLIAPDASVRAAGDRLVAEIAIVF